MSGYIAFNPVVAESSLIDVMDDRDRQALLDGEILLKTRPYSAWGGAVTARMYLPVKRSQAWQQLTNYPQWVKFFPDLVSSQVIGLEQGQPGIKRVYQVARKSFLMFSAQVEIYLKVFERVQTTEHQIQFRMEQGDFTDFAATLQLQDCGVGTVLTYAVQATPKLPIPSKIIQEAIRLDLPTNLRKMRQTLCNG